LTNDPIAQAREQVRLAQLGVLVTGAQLEVAPDIVIGYVYLRPEDPSKSNGYHAVFIPGLSHSAWSGYELGLALARRGTDVYLLNRRTMGQPPIISEWRGGHPAGVQVDDHQRDLAAFIRAARLPLSHTILAGHSFGGFVIQDCLAHLAPEEAAMVPCAVLVETIDPKRVLGVNMRLVGRMTHYPKVLFTLLGHGDLFATPAARRVLLLERDMSIAADQDARVVGQLCAEPPSTFTTKSVLAFARDFTHRGNARHYVVTSGRHDAFFRPADVRRLADGLRRRRAAVELLALDCAHDGLFQTEHAERIAVATLSAL